MSKDFKQRLNRREILLGTWISLPSEGLVEIAAFTGLDWITIDLEHSTIGIESAGNMIRVASLSSVASLVRLPCLDENMAKRVLDFGASGIIVPMINNAADAQKAVAMTRYHPRGTRGVGMHRAQKYTPEGFAEYMAESEDNTVVILQVEHIEGVNNLSEILSVEGVSGVLIGPYDLSCSINMAGDFNSEAFRKVVAEIVETANAFEMPLGYHLVEPNLDELEKLFATGYQFVAFSVDFRMVDVALRQAVAAKRNLANAE